MHALDTRYATRTLCKQSREHHKACSHYRCNTWATERLSSKGRCGGQGPSLRGSRHHYTTGLNAKLGHKWTALLAGFDELCGRLDRGSESRCYGARSAVVWRDHEVITHWYAPLTSVTQL